MKKMLGAGAAFAVVALACAGAFGAANKNSAADTSLPLWAWGYVTPPPASPLSAAPAAAPTPALDNTTKHTLPGSKFSFTRAEAGQRYAPVDWYPEDHPAMPDIVAHGRESAQPNPIYPCGLCHMPNGKGRPENANVTGLTYEYIVQQLHDFRDGLRVTSDPRKTNTALMAGFAKSMTDEDIKAAATYFAQIPATKWITVKESTTVPLTRQAGGVFLPLEGDKAGSEPLGNRIIETPISVEDFELWRNPRSGFIAYVPAGSVKKGEALARTGNGKVTACTVCHGADLRGLGPVPRLAGRSPSYLGRQLYDMQKGNRIGAWSPLMAPVVGHLTSDDILNVSAYLASLEP